MTFRPTLPRLLALALYASFPAAAQPTHVDPTTGALTWEIRAHGVTLSLTQILPNQARAFYLNRGFPPEAVEPYATACVYMTVLRNDAAPGELSFRLADWSVLGDDQERPPQAMEEWMAQWRARVIRRSWKMSFAHSDDKWLPFPGLTPRGSAAIQA